VATEVGEKAPAFTLPSDSWENKVSLEEARREGSVALFFYPGDWLSVCTDKMGQVQQEIGRFKERSARVVAMSVDSPWSHRAWVEEAGRRVTAALGPRARGGREVWRRVRG
jgi:peroxiredoxin